eukprot:GHVS01065737.1.p1 GENE.GHVS01065737.1~~GHVS01065737.1.p1  ORF type:complete len:218 (-),score=34.92 GHVS01065737.1:220-873(-)
MTTYNSPHPSSPPPVELLQTEPTSSDSQTVTYTFNNSLQLATTKNNNSTNDKAKGRRSHMTPWLLFVVVFASMTGLLMGYDLAVVSVVLKPVTEHFGICPKGSSMCHQKEVFVAMIAPGALVGSIVGGSLADMFGRRWAMAVRDVAVIVGTVLQATTDFYGVLHTTTRAIYMCCLFHSMNICALMFVVVIMMLYCCFCLVPVIHYICMLWRWRGRHI